MKTEAYDRKEFLALLKTTMPGIDTKDPSFTGSDCYIFRDGKLSTFNDYAGVSVPCTAPFEGALPHNTLYQIVNSFSGNDLFVTHDNGTVIFKSGKAKASIKLLDEIVYSRLERLFTDDLIWRKLPNKLVETIKGCMLNGASKFDGVFLQGSDIYATDGTAIVHESIDAQLETVWLSRKAVKMLVAMGEFEEYAVSSSWLHLKRGEMTYSTKKLFEDSYPLEFLNKYIKSWETSESSCLLNFTGEFLASMKRGLVFADKGSEAKWVTLILRGDTCTINVKGGAGEYTDEFPLTNPNEADFKVAVDLTILVGALGGMKSGTIGFHDANGKRVLAITGTDRVAIVGTMEKK